MKIHLLLAGVAIATVGAAGIASAAVTVADASFENPSVPGGYEYGVQVGAQNSSNGIDAAATGVVFGAGSGVQANGSAWGFASAPSGVQTAFLQSYDNYTPGQIAQDVSGLVAGKSYDVSFYIADRPGFGVNPVTVSFGGVALGTFTPASTSFSEVTSGSFVATASTGVITFSTGLNGGDADIGLDNVSISAVPEPATWAMMLVGFGGMGVAMRSRRKQAVAAI
jgi:hypothetical protein